MDLVSQFLCHPVDRTKCPESPPVCVILVGLVRRTTCHGNLIETHMSTTTCRAYGGRPNVRVLLQEVAAAGHVLIKYGRTEIDGYAFCSGLSALNVL
ncbi:hypothetical protein V2G26_020031 [Clonostachys chloroleuca]